MSTQTRPTFLLSTDALRRRHQDLIEARKAIDTELGKITKALQVRGTHTGPKRTAQHGTDGGYYAHRRRWKTPPCPACIAAHAAADRRRREARAGAA